MRFHKAGKVLWFWRAFIKKKVCHVLDGGCFLPSTAEIGFHQKRKPQKAEILQLTPWHFLASVSLDLALVALGCWQPSGFPGGKGLQPGLPRLGSAGTALVSLSTAMEQSKQHCWPRGQGDDRHIFNPSYPNNSRCFTNGILQLTNALLSFLPPRKLSLPALQLYPIPWSALQTCSDIAQWTRAMF